MLCFRHNKVSHDYWLLDTISNHRDTFVLYIHLLNIHSVLYRCRKLVTWSKKWPFYCNYNFTCSISVHVQTLNEYLDAKIHSNTKITSEYPNGANIHFSPSVISSIILVIQSLPICSFCWTMFMCSCTLIRVSAH